MRLLLIFILVNVGIAKGQAAVQAIDFRFLFGEFPLQLNDSFLPDKNDSIRIEELKVYVSGIELWNDNRQVWKEENSFHLIDIANPASLKLLLNTQSQVQFDQLRFKMGIDSITNVSGAMGGDLDPTKGMYWSWQSGYINCKIEGTSSRSTNSNHAFQFHLGGYQYPYNALQPISLNVKKGTAIHIAFDVKAFLTQVDLAQQTDVMSPGKQAIGLSQKMAQLFKVIEQ